MSLECSQAIREDFIKNPVKKITQENSPKLYNLVKKISKKANYEINNIFVKKAKYKTVEKDIIDYKIVKKIKNLTPVISKHNLILYKEALSNLSDEEIEGLLAISFSDSLKYYFFIPFVFSLITYFEIKFFINSDILQKFILFMTLDNKKSGEFILSFFSIAPLSFIVSYIFYLQKIQDIKALSLTKKENVISGILALKRLNRKFNNISFPNGSRFPNLIDKLMLRLTCFIRPYTIKERIDYVQRAA